jgi:hypothetical protein
VTALAKNYSPFPALLLFFATVLVMDLDQTVKIHRQKLEVMQQYVATLQVQKQANAQLKWMNAMRQDLLRLAPGDPEAAQIVADLHLQPQKAAH